MLPVPAGYHRERQTDLTGRHRGLLDDLQQPTTPATAIVRWTDEGILWLAEWLVPDERLIFTLRRLRDRRRVVGLTWQFAFAGQRSLD